MLAKPSQATTLINDTDNVLVFFMERVDSYRISQFFFFILKGLVLKRHQDQESDIRICSNVSLMIYGVFMKYSISQHRQCSTFSRYSTFNFKTFSLLNYISQYSRGGIKLITCKRLHLTYIFIHIKHFNTHQIGYLLSRPTLLQFFAFTEWKKRVCSAYFFPCTCYQIRAFTLQADAVWQCVGADAAPKRPFPHRVYFCCSAQADSALFTLTMNMG